MANRLSVEESKAAVADEGAPDPLLELLKTIRKHNEQYARQDRDREPAAELPERIRREREEQSSPTVNGVSKVITEFQLPSVASCPSALLYAPSWVISLSQRTADHRGSLAIHNNSPGRYQRRHH